MIDLMPLPKRISRQADYYHCGDVALKVGLAAQSPRLRRALGSDAGIRISTNPEHADVVLRLDPHEASLRSLDNAIRRQAYKLNIRPLGIEITGADDQGIYYGWLTLQQLVARYGRRLPVCRILDWPDLALRGVHLDLWKNAPSFKELKAFVVQLANYKINSICLEYDDRFRFDRHPLLAHPEAYTKDQLRELVELAESLFVDVVPLLDSLGHAEQYLRHKPYLHLRELPDQIHEMCPSNPRTITFIQDLWDEVLEVHCSANYAHISGDEVFRLGRLCPRCAARAGRSNKASLYTAYYSKLSRWILERGKTPMIWGDMLIKCPEDLANFPKDIIIQDWCYYGIDRPWWDRPQPKWHPLFKKYGAMLEENGACLKSLARTIPRQDRDLIARYWVHSFAKRQFYPFPHVRFLQDRGFRVIGASAASDESGLIISWPSPSRRFANAKRFAETLRREGSLGIVNTHWSCHGSVKDAWYGFVAGADFAWHVRDESEVVFAGRFARRFLNGPDKIGDVIRNLDRQINAERYGYQSVQKYKALAEKAGPVTVVCTSLSKRSRREGDYAQLLARVSRINLRQTAHTAKALERFSSGNAEHCQYLNLNPWMNRDFNNCGPTPQTISLPLQPGRQVVGNIPFNVVDPANNNGSSVIVMRGERMPGGLDVIQDIPIRGKVCCIYVFLTGYNVLTDVKLADMTIHYVNGWADSMAIVGGINLADWSGNGSKSLRHAVVGWVHANGRRAYMTRWRNPCPEQALQSLDIVSAQANGYIMLLSMTARMLV